MTPQDKIGTGEIRDTDGDGASEEEGGESIDGSKPPEDSKLPLQHIPRIMNQSIPFRS